LHCCQPLSLLLLALTLLLQLLEPVLLTLLKLLPLVLPIFTELSCCVLHPCSQPA
jgi:hypothetical protein